MNTPTGLGEISFNYLFRYSHPEGQPFLIMMKQRLEEWQKELQHNPDPFARLYQWREVAPSPPSTDSFVTPDPSDTSDPLQKWKAEVRIQEAQIKLREAEDLFAESAQYWEQKYRHNEMMLGLLRAHQQINMMAKELESIEDAKREALSESAAEMAALYQRVNGADTRTDIEKTLDHFKNGNRAKKRPWGQRPPWTADDRNASRPSAIRSSPPRRTTTTHRSGARPPVPPHASRTTSTQPARPQRQEELATPPATMVPGIEQSDHLPLDAYHCAGHRLRRRPEREGGGGGGGGGGKGGGGRRTMATKG
ncbi:MAG: hypothetical protein M1823_000494 [Watsoniomyces obsoletus]|nr:MAG: hypothetical protein M1823_000494 [Watsoniomyces obsoletus]